jgi:flagellar motor protein MotB
MTARLADAMEVNDDDLRALGAARAQQVRDYFVQTGKIDLARLFLANVAAGATTQNKGPRVFLTLQ